MRISPRAAVLLAAVLAAGLSPAAASDPALSTVQLPYRQPWTYTVSAETGGDFAKPGFDPATAGWMTGQAPFFNGTYLCGFDREAGGTNFPLNSTLLLRRTVDLPAGAQSVRVRGTIDNDADVYWNGAFLGRVQNGDCTAGGIDIAVPSDLVSAGANVLAVRAIDHGVLSYFDATVTYAKPTDVAPPTITATVTPPPNDAGWNDVPVTLAFTCTDDGTVAACGPDTELTADGIHTVTGTAVDGTGKTATVDVGPIRIDRTAPVIAFSGADRTYAVDETVTVACTATDAPSGVAADDCAQPLVQQAAHDLAPGVHTVTATAVDVAGNAVTSSAHYTVAAVDDAALGRLVTAFSDKPGVAAALLGKLDAAATAPTSGARAGALGAFANQVRAQTGKALSAEEAGVLLRLAAAL